MEIKRSLQMVHRHPEHCDPDIPLPFGEPIETDREELEAMVERDAFDLDLCEVCFSDWQ
jgi:hypothetical protein